MMEKINLNSTLEENIEKNREIQENFLSKEQEQLYLLFSQKYYDLGNIYYGAIHVLHQKDNPDRFALAAHGIRELMEKFPEYLKIDTQAHNESLKGKVREIENEWEKMRKVSKCNAEGKWNGEIDSPMLKYLKRMATFFDWVKVNHPKRKEEVKKTLRNINGSTFILPSPLEDLNVEYWSKINRYFQKVSHHRNKPDDDEFRQWLTALENFMLSRWKPKTFDDINHIDELIKEGEDGD